MKNYLSVIFHDSILSLITKKYGTKLNDSQKEDKADEFIRILHDQNAFTCDQTQAIIDKKGITNYMATQVDGKPVFALTKEGMFHKVKVCYFITRIKDTEFCMKIPVIQFLAWNGKFQFDNAIMKHP